MEDPGDDLPPFAHEKAPWIGLEVVSWSPRRFELVVLQTSVPDDPEDVIRLEALRRIYRGFETIWDPLQVHMVERIEAFERSHAS